MGQLGSEACVMGSLSVIVAAQVIRPRLHLEATGSPPSKVPTRASSPSKASSASATASPPALTSAPVTCSPYLTRGFRPRFHRRRDHPSLNSRGPARGMPLSSVSRTPKSFRWLPVDPESSDTTGEAIVEGPAIGPAVFRHRLPQASFGHRHFAVFCDLAGART